MELSFFLSFFTGLLAALNPCTAPIYPLVFSYYLKKDGTITWKNVALFIVGFLGAFLVLASIILLFGALGTVQEFIRFVAAGVVALLGIDILLRGFRVPQTLARRLENINNPLLFGAIFGLALNPCSLPLFLANIVIATIAFNFLNVLFFALGVGLPPILAAIFGASLIKWLARRTRGAYQYIDRVVGSFLIIAAGFIVWVVAASPLTAVISSVFILVFFVLLIVPFWKQIFSAKKLRTELWLLTAFMVFLWGVLTFHCYTVSYSTHFSCGATCQTCRLCSGLLVAVLLFGYLGFYRLHAKSNV